MRTAKMLEQEEQRGYRYRGKNIVVTTNLRRTYAQNGSWKF